MVVTKMKPAKVTKKGGTKGQKSTGIKKKKQSLKFVIECKHPVEDGIMNVADFVCF